MHNVPLIGSSLKSVKLVGPVPTGAVFDPATLALSGYWKDYAGGAWAGTASAGTSAGNTLASAGVDPTVGTLNAHGVAVYNGTTQYLTFGALNGLFAAGTGTIVVLFNATAAHADTGLWYEEPSFIGSNGAAQEVGLGFSSAGVVGGDYDGVSFNRLAVPASTAAWHLASMTWNGAVIRIRVDNGAFSTTPSGNISDLTFGGFNGQSSFLANFFNGNIAAIMTANTVISDANLDNIRGWANTRYGVSV